MNKEAKVTPLLFHVGWFIVETIVNGTVLWIMWKHDH